MHTIFVYGSLKRGQRLHDVLLGQQFLGLAETLPDYALFDCGEYPALVKVSTNGDSVKGELYRVEPNCLQNLDLIEGVDQGLYSRQPVNLQSVNTFHKDSHIVWAWYYQHSIEGLRQCGREWP